MRSNPTFPTSAPAFDAAGFLALLNSRGIVLTAHGGKIRFDAPAGEFTPELRATAAEHRGALLRLLASGTSGTQDLQAQDLRGDDRSGPRDPQPQNIDGDGAPVGTGGRPDFLNPCPSDAGKFLRWLRADIRRGPGGPWAFYGALQADLRELQRFALQAGDKRQPEGRSQR